MRRCPNCMRWMRVAGEHKKVADKVVLMTWDGWVWVGKLYVVVPKDWKLQAHYACDAYSALLLRASHEAVATGCMTNADWLAIGAIWGFSCGWRC